MRLEAIVLAAFMLSACSERTPTSAAGPIPPFGSTFLWGYVVDASGVCIVGASVHVVAGQRIGETITQSTPCDAWANDGGFRFDQLAPGKAMTLRVSAPGHVELEQMVTPTLGPQTAVLLSPSRQSPATPW